MKPPEYICITCIATSDAAGEAVSQSICITTTL